MRLYYGLSQEQKDYIEKRYSENVGCTTIAKELNITQGRVSGHIKRHMIPRDNRHKGLKNKCDEFFFDNIDCERKAYWVGFILADGYVQNIKGSKKLGISLSNRDISHLYKFKDDIQFTGEIKTYINNSGFIKGTEYSRIIMISDHLYDSLGYLGIIEHKTKIAYVANSIKQLNNNLQIAFIRGYIDGDGSIAVCHNKHGIDYVIRIVGTYDVLSYIQNTFQNNNIPTYSKFYKRRKTDIVWQYDIGGRNNVKKTLDLLYENASIYLDRKYQRYQDFCDDYYSRASLKSEV